MAFAERQSSEEKGGRWSPEEIRGKSELRRVRVPGESQGGVETRRQSRVARCLQRESNRNQTAPVRRKRLKRAILPAAISDPAVTRCLAEAESREPLNAGSASPSGLREMIAWKQNSAYSLFLQSLLHRRSRTRSGSAEHMVPLAQPVRALVCGTRGHGFEPRKAPHLPHPRPLSRPREKGVFARVAQWIEHWSSEPGAAGSNPASRANHNYPDKTRQATRLSSLATVRSSCGT